MRNITRTERALEILRSTPHSCPHPIVFGGGSNTDESTVTCFIEALNYLFDSETELVCFYRKNEGILYNVGNIFHSAMTEVSVRNSIRWGRSPRRYLEKWLLSEEKEFKAGCKKELSVLENVIMSNMIYMLGGFTSPKDDLRKEPLKYMEVDLEEILNEPRNTFLLLNINPRYMLLFLVWKIGTFIQAGSREFHWLSPKKEEKRKKLNILRDRLHADKSEESRSYRLELNDDGQ